jgi:hypothetical protein
MKDKTIRILIVKNNLSVDISSELNRWKEYELKYSGLELDFKVVETSIPLKHKSFGIYTMLEGAKTDMYGLDGVKDQLRKLGTVPEFIYHAVFFIYNIEQTEFFRSKSTQSLGAWTYFQEYSPGTIFVELPSFPILTNDLLRILTHEIRHVFVARLRRLGIPVLDYMDSTPKMTDCATGQVSPTGKCLKWFPYYKEYDIYALDGNRAMENSLLFSLFDRVPEQPELDTFITQLKNKIMALQEKLFGKPVTAGITKWAEAIKQHEGWFIGSRSYRNNNPGNFKFSPVGYRSIYGTVGKDDKGFAIFPTYELGWTYLVNSLKNQCLGKSEGYFSGMTLQAWAKRYCEDDKNTPEDDQKVYADVISKAIGNGVTPYTSIINIYNIV